MATVSAPSASAEPDRILIVDDDPTNLQVLLQTLKGRGYKLLVAKSGEECLTIARSSGPGLILLDVMMAGIDGFETCQRLKADPATRDAAVIFLSALDQKAVVWYLLSSTKVNIYQGEHRAGR